MANNKQQTINVIIRDNECEEIRLTAVEIIQDYLKFIGFIDSDKTVPQVIKGVINTAKRAEKEQAQEYAAFCVKCDRENLPLLEFDGWVKLEGGNK